MKGRAISYNAHERTWIKANATRSRREAHHDFCLIFDRPDVSFTNFKQLCKRNGWLTGRTGHFTAGGVAHNKGKKMPFNANSARTQFKRGQLPPNAKYLGHERVSKDGYVEISIAETNPHTGFKRRYVLKHRHLWQQINGPVPEGSALKCLDGNKTNCDPSNWACIPRAMLPRLNGRFGRDYDTAPAELKPIIMKVATLEHKARSRSKPEGE